MSRLGNLNPGRRLGLTRKKPKKGKAFSRFEPNLTKNKKKGEETATTFSSRVERAQSCGE
jgi:hypothetical protein